MSDQVLTILRGARELVATGWGQHTSVRYQPGGRVEYCPLGAIAKAGAEYGNDFRGKSVRELKDALGVESIIAFNDDPSRTQAEVVDAFDRAIARLGQGES
jgi:hypothetical protein